MAQTAVDIVVKVVGDQKLKRLDTSLRGTAANSVKAATGLDRSAKSARNLGNQARRAEPAVNKLGGAIRGLVTAAAVLGTAKFVIGKTAELETQTRSLQVLTGELAKAEQIIGRLQKFAAVTPFTSSELIETSKRLAAFGVDTEKLVETTKRLADVSGATGAALDGVATAYGQIVAKGRLQGEELLQLQERGIGIQEELQKMYGLTGEEFRKALEKGKISAAAVELAIKRLTAAGGKYADGAISQSDTLAGKFSTLVDGIENIARKLGTVLAPALKQVLDLAIDVVNNINAAFAARSITDQQKQGFKAQAEAEVQRFAGSQPGGAFGAGKIVVRTNGKTYTGQASSVVSQITNDLINKEVQRLTESAAPKIAKSDVKIETKVPPLLDSSGTGTKSGGKSSSSAAKAADEAERQAKAIADGLRASEESLAVMKQRLSISEAGSKMLKEQARLELDRLQINQDYDARMRDAIENEFSIQQKINIELERGLALRNASVTAQQQMMNAAQSEFTNFFQQQPEYASLFNDELTQTQQLLKGSYEIVSGGLTSGIQGLIDGTKDWGDVLSDIASQLGSMLLNFGFKMLGGSLGIPGFADGGRPPIGEVSLVGERGPELFIPDQPGRIVSNEQSKAAMSMYSPGNDQMAPNAPMTTNITYSGPTLNFNGDDYIPRSEASSLVSAGAKQGEQRAMNRLRQSRSTRSKLGM